MAEAPFEGLSPVVADELARAKAEQARAEATKAIAEAEKAETERQRALLGLEQDEIRMVKERHGFKEWQAADAFYRIYYFLDAVTDVTAERCIATLDLWDRLDPECDMTIVFNSPGGDVVAGLAMFDHIQTLRRKGHKITTRTEGIAASMAGILLQAGDHRVMGPEAWVLIHEAAFGTSGKTFQVEDRVEWVKRVQERILEVFARRAKEAGENGTASHPMTKAGFKKNWARKDWWLSSDECLKYGVVDEVA